MKHALSEDALPSHVLKPSRGPKRHHLLSAASMVFAGALAGAALRVIIVSFLNVVDLGFYGWNWTYLFINIIGAFAFGFVISVFKYRLSSKSEKWYALVCEGATASFTTFDLVFSQISLLFLQPNIWVLIFYVAINFAACVIFSSFGIFLGSGKKITRREEGASRQLPTDKDKKRAPSARHGY